MSQQYKTVAQVAEEFSVSSGAVREWITTGKLMAIQPGGDGCAYRIPEAAVKVFGARRAGVRQHRVPRRVRAGTPFDIYDERIQPVLAETGLSADDLLRRLSTDAALVARYPSFASDYSAFVRAAARAVTQQRRAMSA